MYAAKRNLKNVRTFIYLKIIFKGVSVRTNACNVWFLFGDNANESYILGITLYKDDRDKDE